MLFEILHRTRYVYSAPVTESYNEVRLCPTTDSLQSCVDFRLEVRPYANVRSYQSAGGTVHFFNLREPHTELEIVAAGRVETTDPPSMDDAGKGWDYYATEDVRQDFAEFLAPTPLVPFLPEAEEMAAAVMQDRDEGPATFLHRFTQYLHAALQYVPGATHVQTPLDEFIRSRSGVCQDFAHLMLAACRSSGLPSRYVSGYLYTGDDPHAPAGPGATHAWVECLLPDGDGGAWRAYDPTNPDKPADHYVAIHRGRDYADVVPVKGVYRGAPSQSLCVEVWVTEANTAVHEE